MAKNLLKQVMIKDTKKKKRNSEEDENLVEGLDTAINAGYLTKTKPKFTKKTNFSASNLTYGSGECPRYCAGSMPRRAALARAQRIAAFASRRQSCGMTPWRLSTR